jgi:hypothetical protein
MNQTRRQIALNTAPQKALKEYDLYRVVEVSSALLSTWDVTRWNDAERSYTVMADEYDWTCTCPACERDTHCKHIEIVRLHLSELEADEARANAFTANEGDYFFMQECIAENLAETAGAWFN